MSNLKRAAVVEFTAFSATAKKSKQMLVKGRGFYSLSYRHEGKTLIKTDDTAFVSEADSITFMPKGIPYVTEIIDDVRMSVIHFDLDRDIDLRKPEVISIKGTKIAALFEKLVQNYRVDNPTDFNCMAMLYELFAQLEALASHEDRRQIPKKIGLAREYMQQNCAAPYFSVADTAEHLGISTSYLRRGFSMAYGESPISFLTSLRVGRAKNMLESEYLTVAEIAEQSGFTSPSYFIQVFRKATGESPNQYRKRVVSIISKK